MTANSRSVTALWRGIVQRCSATGPFASCLTKTANRARSVRHATIPTHVDACSGETAVRLLRRGGDREGGAGLEVGLVADLVAHDGNIIPYNDFLLSIPVFDQHDGSIHAADQIPGW